MSTRAVVLSSDLFTTTMQTRDFKPDTWRMANGVEDQLIALIDEHYYKFHSDRRWQHFLDEAVKK
jgi:hypothetical protein